MTPIGSALDLRSIWVDGQASHDPVGRAWENVAGEEGREVLKEIDFKKPNFRFQGCITAEELKFVLTHLPGKVTYKEIDEMIRTVDENGDGKINYQEFRVMIGAKPNLKAAREAQKAAEAVKKTTATSTTNTTMTFTTTVGTMATNGMHANTMTTAAGGMKWTQRWTLCVSLVEVEQLSTSLSRLSYSPLRQQSVKYLMLSIEKAKEEMKVA